MARGSFGMDSGGILNPTLSGNSIIKLKEMSDYKSSSRRVNASAEAVYDKLSNLSAFRDVLANVPESAVPADQRDLLDKVSVTDDSITFPAGPVGEITLQVTQRVRPTHISLEGVGTPVPLGLMLTLVPGNSEECEAIVSMDVAIPAMLKPMVGGTLQKMVDQFADVIQRLEYE